MQTTSYQKVKLRKLEPTIQNAAMCTTHQSNKTGLMNKYIINVPKKS